MSEFYNRFIHLCKSKGVTPTGVAKAIGISTPNVTYWKNGSIPKTTTMASLSEYFGCTLDYLSGKVPEPDGLLVYADEVETPAQFVGKINEIIEKGKQSDNDLTKSVATAMKAMAEGGLENLEVFEFNNFSKMLDTIGYRIILSDDDQTYYITDGKKNVPITEEELKTLARASRASVRGIVSDFMNKDKTP